MSYMYKDGKVWRLELCRNGVRKDVNLGPDYEKAKLVRSSIDQAWQDEKFKKNLTDTLAQLGMVISDSAGVVSDKSFLTWKDAKDKILEHLRKINRKERTIVMARDSLESIETVLQPQSPTDVTSEKADEWIASLLNSYRKNDRTGKTRIKASYASVLVRSASACFSRWVRWKIIRENPFFNCDKPKLERTLPKPFTEEELDRVLVACNAPLARAVRIMSCSGMRPDEYLHLTWKRVDLDDRKSIVIEKDGDWIPKSHQERIIPCTPKLIVALGKSGPPGDLVAGKNNRGFVITSDWLGKAFNRAVKRAGLAGRGFSPYSCRDTYATNLALEGYEAHAIAARLGHSGIQTSMHYVSLAKIVADVKPGNRRSKGG